MNRPTWPVTAAMICRCYISGSITMVVCTFITGLAQYGYAGVNALWPLLVGWGIAGLPVSMAAANRLVAYVIVGCATGCFFLGFMASMPQLR